MQRIQGLIGISLILGLAFVFSNNRRLINLRLVVSGLILQLLIGIMVLKITPVIHFFQFLGRVMGKIEHFAFQGAAFVYDGIAVPVKGGGVMNYAMGGLSPGYYAARCRGYCKSHERDHAGEWCRSPE